MTERREPYSTDKPTDAAQFWWQGYAINTSLPEASHRFRRRYGYGALAVWYDEAGHVYAGPIREVG